MQVDRNLGKTSDGRVVERDDLDCVRVLCAKGTVFTEAEAQRLGITAFYDNLERAKRRQILADAKAAEDAKAQPPEAKAVQQSEVEDKSVSGPQEVKAEEPKAEEATPEEPSQAPRPGVIFPPEVRRGGGRRGS